MAFHKIISNLLLKSGLYIISTPIGNLRDISLRGLDIMKKSDIIFCEDTRISSKLLAEYGISSKLKIYNEQSSNTTRSLIKDMILDDKIVSLISDAGTPLISDPGYKLVRYLRDENLYVDVIPGACSIIASLVLSGMPIDRFFYAGFIPKGGKKRKFFRELISINASLVFFETANRLIDSLTYALEILGDREANIGRELTKLHQESRTAKLSELIKHYNDTNLRGEIVLTISGAEEQEINHQDISLMIKKNLSNGMSRKDTSNIIFNKYNKILSKKEIYKMVNKYSN